MTDVAQLISVDSEEDDEDEEDDPDYEPLSMEEDSIQAREMVSHPSSRKQLCRQGSHIPRKSRRVSGLRFLCMEQDRCSRADLVGLSGKVYVRAPQHAGLQHEDAICSSDA